MVNPSQGSTYFYYTVCLLYVFYIMYCISTLSWCLSFYVYLLLYIYVMYVILYLSLGLQMEISL